MPENILVVVLLIIFIILAALLAFICWLIHDVVKGISIEKLKSAAIDIINAWERKQKPKTSFTSKPESGGQGYSKVERQDKKVGQLPPEAIAPNFAKPPRPPGGFGSSTSEQSNSDS